MYERLGYEFVTMYLTVHRQEIKATPCEFITIVDSMFYIVKSLL
jgi:hypothetical protein